MGNGVEGRRIVEVLCGLPGSRHVPLARDKLYHVVGTKEAAAIGARVGVLGGGRDAEEAAQAESEST